MQLLPCDCKRFQSSDQTCLYLTYKFSRLTHSVVRNSLMSTGTWRQMALVSTMVHFCFQNAISFNDTEEFLQHNFSCTKYWTCVFKIPHFLPKFCKFYVTFDGNAVQLFIWMTPPMACDWRHSKMPTDEVSPTAKTPARDVLPTCQHKLSHVGWNRSFNSHSTIYIHVVTKVSN